MWADIHVGDLSQTGKWSLFKRKRRVIWNVVQLRLTHATSAVCVWMCEWCHELKKKGFERIKLPAKLLDYSLRCDKSNIHQLNLVMSRGRTLHTERKWVHMWKKKLPFQMLGWSEWCALWLVMMCTLWFLLVYAHAHIHTHAQTHTCTYTYTHTHTHTQ